MERQPLVGRFRIPVLPVAHDRMASVGQVYAYLVLPARQQVNLQQSERAGLLEHSVRSA